MARAKAKPTIVTDVPRLPERPAEMHKGVAGHVAIVAGSRGMSGAALLAGLGALRGGAGLVRVFTPASVQPIVAAGEPCLMTVPLPESRTGQLATRAIGTIEEMALAWAHAVAIGPGLGASATAGSGVTRIVREVLAGDVPVVVDADALNAAPGELPDWLAARTPERPVIVTPHPGEMARLRAGTKLRELRGGDAETRLRLAHEYAKLTGAVVVLKGHETVVATPAEAYVNATGNPGMASGGMGDVLTGLLAALAGQGLSAFEAARLGVYAHGLAADRCAQHIGPVGYLARDVAEALPAALAEASRESIGFR
ncbi:MAG: NAD(P)H-hydrate dehydratase [Phycisphaerae bacterium]|jgi:NAD(P)H-hydrate epimerase